MFDVDVLGAMPVMVMKVGAAAGAARRRAASLAGLGVGRHLRVGGAAVRVNVIEQTLLPAT